MGHNADVVTIVVSGPQATGKTTLALALGRALAAPVFSRDPLMAVLSGGRDRRSGLRRDWVHATGLRLQTVLLGRQLDLGQSAVLECIVLPAVRQQWRAMTMAAGQPFLSVECVCTDVAAYRARFEERRGTARRQAMAWNDVLTTIRHYRPDQDADFVADAMRPVTDLVADVVSLVSLDRPTDQPGEAGTGHLDAHR
jgi:predicted kinase